MLNPANASSYGGHDLVLTCGRRVAVGFAGKKVEGMGKSFVEIRHIRGEQSPEKEVEKHRWNRQQKSTAGRDERLSDSLGEIGGFCFPCREGAKAGDHSRNGSEKPDHWSQNGEGIHVVHHHHHLCLIAKTVIGDRVFHRRLIIHVAFEIGLHEGSRKNRSEEARIRRAVIVGGLKVTLTHEPVQMVHDGGGHELRFSKHQKTIRPKSHYGDGAECNEVHNGTSLSVEVEEAFVAGDLGGACCRGREYKNRCYENENPSE